MTPTGLLSQLHLLNRSSSTFHDQLSSILYGEEFKQQAPNLESDGLVWLVDYLDKALDILDPASCPFRKCLRELRNICGTRMILPTSYTLSSSLLNIGRQPVASGGSGDIYQGTLNGLAVCVKRVRVYSKEGPKKATKTLYQEAVVWKHLSHPNIVPLLGITPVPLQLISEWMPGGDLTEYIRKNPGSNRLDLLSDVAEGLYYLHSCNIVHGDLKGPNILVDPVGCARITDFGLATVTQNLDSMRSASDDKNHTARWTAPEILNERGTYSKKADVFSFGMVMIEVFTGTVPFNNNPPATVVLAIINGKRPSRPIRSDFTDELWTLMQHCWDQNLHLRPEISEVLKVLSGSHPSTATLAGAQKQLFDGDPMESHTPSLHQASSFSCHNLQIAPEKPNNVIDPLRPESRVDPQPFDCGELQEGQAHNQVYGHTGGTGKSHVDLQGRPTSRRDVSGKVSQFDLNCDLENDDEGKYWSGAQRDNYGASRISGTLCEKQFRDCVSNLPDDEVAQLVDYLDNVICALDPASPNFWKSLHRLGWVCGTRGTLPKSCKIPDTSLLIAGNQPFASGALADMHEGNLNGSKVCVEKFRVYSEENSQRVMRTFCKGVVIRKHLRHRNIVPFLGATLDPPQLVSAWMPGGGLADYVAAHPEKNRLHFLHDVAQGLDHLHSLGMIHGNLKASNILIDDTGRARVAGLDLIVATSDVGSTASTTGGPAVWLAAPEVLGTGTTISKEADIFSFAMTVVEVFTGAAPFAHTPPTAVAVRILSGKRPGRPEHPSLTDDLWNLNQRCWAQEPLLRPKISEVVRHLQTSLAVQEGHADRTDTSTIDDTASTSSLKREASHRLPYGLPHPTATRWFLAFYKHRQLLTYQVAFDERFCIGPNGSGDGLYDTKSGEWEKPLDIRHPSSSRGILRMVADWLRGRRTRSTQNRRARPDDLSQKHSREEAGMTLPDLTAGTTSDSVPNPNNLPPTPVHRVCRSCTSMKPTMFQCIGSTTGIVRSLTCPPVSSLPSCRSNKHMDH